MFHGLSLFHNKRTLLCKFFCLVPLLAIHTTPALQKRITHQATRPTKFEHFARSVVTLLLKGPMRLLKEVLY